MIIETNFIVLKKTLYKESQCLLQVFSPEYGKLTLFAFLPKKKSSLWDVFLTYNAILEQKKEDVYFVKSADFLQQIYKSSWNYTSITIASNIALFTLKNTVKNTLYNKIYSALIRSYELLDNTNAKMILSFYLYHYLNDEGIFYKDNLTLQQKNVLQNFDDVLTSKNDFLAFDYAYYNQLYQWLKTIAEINNLKTF